MTPVVMRFAVLREWQPMAHELLPTPFSTSWAYTRVMLRREVAALGAHECTVELDVDPIHITDTGWMDGESARDARRAAVRIVSHHGPLRFQCDTYTAPSHAWHHNVRAIVLTLEALRTMDRHGVIATQWSAAWVLPELAQLQ